MRRIAEIILICLGLLLLDLAVATLQTLPPAATFVVLAIGAFGYLGFRYRSVRARQTRLDAVFASYVKPTDGILSSDFALEAKVSEQEAVRYLETKAKEQGVQSIYEYEQGGYGWVRFPFPPKPPGGSGDAVT